MINVWILTGYLGSGKTTTVNCLVSSSEFKYRKLALIINEFGKLGVDGALVKPGDYEKYEINKGSIFCICTKTDFLKALDDIKNRTKPDAVIIEATGIAETRDIQSFIDQSPFKNDFHIKANLCMVDAMNFVKVAAFMRSVRGQVEWADGIIINKTDLIAEVELEKLKAVLKSINADAPLTQTSYGKIEADFINKLIHKQRSSQFVTDPPESVFAISFKTEKVINEADFDRIVDENMQNILRFKGNVNFNSGQKYVEVVCDELVKNEPNECLGSGSSFNVIAWDTDKEKMRAEFESLWKD